MSMFIPIFTPFDALCCEFIARKLLVSNTSIKTQEVSECMKINESHDHPSPSADIKKPSKLQMKPRFAPEFDGVYCFETILPYY
ncbi:hypothetical protein Ccrd_017393 [Cynara cardunculus var. scolymus]|uniref:Uncharacterized protein n=1 Tax=Cynara cardunculus var. scolymus TaxID=59895 RepID=A0A103Y861_CYNCS|nr:hypothetical protein Ccrd_017393 [Cynara cardunculus var. scolymus]